MAAPAKGKPAAAASKESASRMGSYTSPNANKFIPNIVSIRTSPLSTISDLLDFFRYSASIAEEQRF